EPAPFVGDLARETAFLLGVRGLLWEWQRANILDLSTFDRIYFLLTQQASKIHPEEGGIKISLPEVAKKELLEFTLESLLEQWHEKAMLSNEQFFYLRKFLTAQLSQAAPATITPLPVPAITPEPVPVPTQSQEIALPAELASPPIAVPPVTLTPPAPPKPREPLIQWDKLWGKVVEAAVSGLLLRWLRYLGAFLFVISIAIVVINFWESIPALGQLAIIFFIPTAFYTGGGYVRNRLQVRQTGAVLMGIGQVLLALAFAAIYRSVGAKIPFEWYWLGTSLICTTLYVFTSWRLVREEFFGYISLAGIGSTMMALAWLLTQTIAWPLTALVGINILIIESAYRLPRASEDWREIGKAGQRFPLIVVPIVLGLLLFVPESDADVARVFSFALATTTAGMLAWRFTRPVYTHLTVWGSVLTAGITLWAFNVPLEWLGTVAAVLSPAYIFSHQGLQKRLEEAFPRRGFHLLPFQLAGFGLLALSIVWGLLTTPFEFWSGVITLTLASVILGGYAPWLRQPLFVLASGGLFLVPFSLAVWRWLEDVFQRSDWLTASWVGLAFVYLGIAALLRQKPRYMRWLTLLAQSLLPLAIVVMGFFSLIRETTFTIPPLVSLGVVIGVYLLTAILHDSKMHPALSEWVNWLPDNLRTAIFLYPISILIPIWVSVAWRGSVLIPAWLGAALAGVTGAYIGIGQLLSRRQIAYRFPFHLTAYFVGIISIFVAIPNKAALITTLYLNTAALAVFAAIYKRPHESFLASILFLWPFQLSLESSQLTLHAHSLAYILLAGLGYVPLGLWLRRKTEVDHHLPILVTGYGISVFAVVTSTLAPLNPTALNVPWIGAVVPLLAAGLYVYSAYILRPEFSWAAVVVFPLGFSQALVWFRIQPA
ncbi:MAG TPA: hypothetical protein VI451_09720, partial [Anaerolineales bacterium]|nr:hypothetical protein [Anaerolineales bacterium]